MKKILTLFCLVLTTLLSQAQLPPPVTSSTPTGPVLDANGNPVPITTCNYDPTTPSNCPHVCRNSIRILSTNNPNDPNERSVTFNFYNPTGNRSLHVVIACASTNLINDCID